MLEATRRRPRNLLSVDLGASNGRVMLATWDGQRTQLREIHRFANGPSWHDETMVWNIHRLFEELQRGIGLAAAAEGPIDSIGIDSWAVDFGLLNEAGELLGLPRHYRDERNVSAAEEVVARVGHEALYDQSGIQYLPFNSLYQLYRLSKENPALLQKSTSMLLIPDLLNYFLTGVRRTEYTNATTTQMLIPGQSVWNQRLLAQLGLPMHFLPPIVQPGTIAGRIVHPNLRHIEALRETQVVHTASHDTASAVVSVPSNDHHYAYISSGTWSLVGTVTNHPVVNEQARRFNFTNEGGVGNTRLLKNVMGLWLLQETQRTLQNQGVLSTVQSLLQQAHLAQRFKFMIDPDHPSLLQPKDMPDAIRRLCQQYQQPVPQTTGELVRGILESLALKYRMVMEELESLTGTHYPCIHIVGGGSQNEMLNQFTANATGKRVVAGPVESSALGNVLVQLMAVGEIPHDRERAVDNDSEAGIHQIVRHSVTTQLYQPRDQAIWEAAFLRFQRAFHTHS